MPYHDPDSATGLCFDNNIGDKMSPSLRNILKKIVTEPGSHATDLINNSSYLEHLPKQGVLLMNTALTVEQSRPGSHLKLWEPFTKKVIELLNERDNIVWLLWGAKALKYKDLVTNDTHHFVISSHPSPLSFSKPLKHYPAFKWATPFADTNKILEDISRPIINW